jgi:uncharacterized protein YdeI (YjbR/CyaY-like superfamily)
MNTLADMPGRRANPVSAPPAPDPPAGPHFDPRIDAYIARAKPFALPILEHLRQLIHQACPQVEESIKWSRPFFTYRGAILCNISAFTQHCSLGFWGEEIAQVLREADALKPGAMGSLGRITALSDLPPDKLLLQWLRQAVAFIDAGSYTSPIAARQKVVKAPVSVPDEPADFREALAANPGAQAIYGSFAASCKREYLEWITSAKRAETRTSRIQTAVAWIAEGKQRHWKYQA